VQGGAAPTAAIRVYLMGVRNVSPLVLLTKLGLEESKMLGADETKEMKKYD